jgi:CHAD domain-containing protein
MKHPFEQYFNRRWKPIRKRLMMPSDALTPMVFHRMRVEMKRINALFALVAFHNPEFDRRKRFAPFRSLFKQMGKIRDLDVETELLERYELRKGKDPYGRYLQKRKNRQLEKFTRLNRSRLVQKLEQAARKARPYLRKLKEGNWQRYLIETQQDIEQEFLGAFPGESQLHDVRKRLKELYYNSLILPVDRQVLKGQAEKMNALQELLGNWHDREVALEKMQRIPRRMRLTGRQAQRFDRTRRALDREKRDLLGRIRQHALQLYGHSSFLTVGGYILVGTVAFGISRLLPKRSQTIAGNATSAAAGPVPTTD